MDPCARGSNWADSVQVKRALKTILIGGGGLLVVAAVTLLLWRIVAQHRTGNRIRIQSTGGIGSIEKVRLGGLDQWIQIRGEDRSKPILLFLHGGPGFPQMPFAHLNADLEKHFVVVHWDQRGAGKSYSSAIPDDAMKVDQFVADTRELTQLLLQRFGAEKCYLVAHSWGSLFGALTASRYPELFHAYVGIGQVAGVPETQQVRYQFAVDSAAKDNNQKALAELRKVGRAPHDFDQCKIMERWVGHYSRIEHTPIASSRFVSLAFSSPVYSWADLVRIPLGVRFSFAQLWKEIFYETDLFRQAPRIDVPVFFFEGRYDEVVTTEVAQRYFDTLDAPRGKRLVWFEESGHWPHFEESEKYRAELIKVVLQQTSPARSDAAAQLR